MTDLGWTVTNSTGQNQQVQGATVLLSSIDNTLGSISYTWHVGLLPDGTTEVSDSVGAQGAVSCGLNNHNVILAPGATVTLLASLDYSGALQQFSAPNDLRVTGKNAISEGRLMVITYSTSQEATVWPGVATVTFWAFPPRFGQKNLIPPPRPAALDYPTTAGPNAEASIDGLLATPAIVPDSGTENTSVANVEFALSPGDISTRATIGILPFKDGG